MKLPFSFGKKQEPIEYYVALLLRDESISVVALEEKNTTLYASAQYSIELQSPLEDIDNEILLNTLDKAITDVESQLPPGASLHKTVFGVKESWVEEAHIKKEYLSRLKKISEELELKPIGFLVFSEAIAHTLQHEEGAPVSAILVEMGKQTTTVVLIRGGKVTETHNAPNEPHPAKTIETILAGITSVEILPSRMLLFASDADKKISHTLLAHVWSKELPFLHVPQVTVLPQGFDIKAVLFGTAAQLGFTPDEHFVPALITNDSHNLSEVSLEKTAHNPEPDVEAEQKILTDNFTAADFGFITNQDAPKIISQKDEKTDTLNSAIADIPEIIKEEQTGENVGRESFSRDGMFIITGLKQTFKKIFTKKKKEYVPPEVKDPENDSDLNPGKKSKRRINKFVILFPVLAALLVAGIVFYIFKEKAIITITLSPKTNTQDEQVAFITDQGNNFNSKQISGSTTTLTESDSLQGQTTGTKSVGDKAKGTITIYNSNTNSQTISSGTTVTSSNGLKFTTNQDVTIASASGDVFSGTKPGTSDVAVTAADIGTDYNLPSGTTFSVTGSNTVAAKNSNAFSGGTKKQVTVVSKDDETKLLDQLTKNLQQKAQNDMNSQAGGDKALLPVFISTKVTKKSFDKNVGDQASSMNLTESIDFQGIAYAKQDVQDFANQTMKDSIGQDLQLANNGIETTVTNAKQNGDKEIDATIHIQAKLYPKINTQQLSQTIKGYSFDKAENFLNNQPQASNVTITLKPNIPLLPKMLPRSESNITIIVNNQ